jgi:hypothetical protein
VVAHKKKPNRSLDDVENDREEVLNEEEREESVINKHQNMFKISNELIHAENEYHLKKEEELKEKLTQGQMDGTLERTGEEIYLSAFPRIMTVCGTVSNLYNTFAEVIPDDIAQTDLLEKTEQGLETYKQGREFFNIIINERDQFQAEVDHFFANIPKVLVTMDEMLHVMSFTNYYENIKKKVDVTESQFVQLDNQLKFETNDFVDKTRYFLVALDNLRNIHNYLYVEMKPFEEKYMDDAVLNILDKIDQGVNMVDAILQLKIRMEGLLTNLTDGVNKIGIIRNNMAVILREMYKLIPATSVAVISVGIFDSRFIMLAMTILLFSFIRND